MGSGASVLHGNQRRLAIFYTSRHGLLVLRGELVGFDTDVDMSEPTTEEYEDHYIEEPCDEVLGLRIPENLDDADWVPSFGTESDYTVENTLVTDASGRKEKNKPSEMHGGR